MPTTTWSRYREGLAGIADIPAIRVRRGTAAELGRTEPAVPQGSLGLPATRAIADSLGIRATADSMVIRGLLVTAAIRVRQDIPANQVRRGTAAEPGRTEPADIRGLREYPGSAAEQERTPTPS